MKRPSLAANVKAAAAEEHADEAPAVKAAPARRMLVPTNATAPTETKRSASREGRKAVYAWVDPAQHMKLKRLSLDTGRSIDALVTEGVSLLFGKHGVEG